MNQGFSVATEEGVEVAGGLNAELAELITEVLNSSSHPIEVTEEFIDFCEIVIKRTRGNRRRAAEIVLAQQEAELRRHKHPRELLSPFDHGRFALFSRGTL